MTMLYTYSNAFLAETIQTSVYVVNTTQAITIPTTVPLLALQAPLIIFIWFLIIAAGVIYGFGFIGNILALVIFSSKDEFRNVSTGVLFLLMTLSNTIHLWTLTTEFLSTFNIYVYSSVFFQCRLNYFVQNVSRSVSTYVAVTITLDRFIRSEFLMRSRRICTSRNAIKLTILYLITSSVFYSFWFYPSNAYVPGTSICYFGSESAYTFFFGNIYLPLRFIFVCLIPVIVMSIANVRMLFNIQKSRQRVAQAMEMSYITGGLTTDRTNPLDRMLFRMVLVNVGAFIITQIPFHIVTIVRTYIQGISVVDGLLIRAVVLIWSSVYFGIGSYFYCLASPLFREALRRTMKKVILCQIFHHREI